MNDIHDDRIDLLDTIDERTGDHVELFINVDAVRRLLADHARLEAIVEKLRKDADSPAVDRLRRYGEAIRRACEQRNPEIVLRLQEGISFDDLALTIEVVVIECSSTREAALAASSEGGSGDVQKH